MQILNEANFHSILRTSQGVNVVMFSGPDCAACKHLERALPEWLGQHMHRLYKVDAQQSAGLARAYEVFHLPSLFVFVDGHYHAPLSAPAAAEDMRRALDAVLNQPAQEEP